MRNATLVGIAILLMLGLAWAAITPRTFFSSDIGLRFLQIQELVAQENSTLAIRYPARSIDPTLAHVPYYYAYSVVDNAIYFNVSPFFPWITAQLVRLFGLVGLPLVPALSSVAAAWALYQLVWLSNLPSPRLAFLAALFGTPLFFYGLVLWDHSLGTALAMWAVAGVAWGMQRKRGHYLLLGGVAAGLAVGQRPELYLFGVALGLALAGLHWRHWRTVAYFAVGGLLGAAPIWWLQWRWVGHPLGMALAPHLLGYGAPERFPIASTAVPWLTKATRFAIYAEPHSPLLPWAIPCVIVGGFLISVTLIAMRRRCQRHYQTVPIQTTSPAFPATNDHPRERDDYSSLAGAPRGHPRLRGNREGVVETISFVSGLILLSCGYLLLAWIARTSALIGVLATLPLFPFVLLRIAPKQTARLIERTDIPNTEDRLYPLALWTAIGFLGAMLATWPGYGGLQWGARYLLPLHPLLIYLAWSGYAVSQSAAAGRGRLLRSGVMLLLALSLLVQGMGLYRIFVDHPKHGIIRRDLLAMPVEYILTNHVFMPSFMTSVTPEKLFLYVRDEAARDQLLTRLLDQGVEQVGMIPRTSRSFPDTPRIDSYQTTVETLPGEYLIYQVYRFEPEEPMNEETHK